MRAAADRGPRGQLFPKKPDQFDPGRALYRRNVLRDGSPTMTHPPLNTVLRHLRQLICLPDGDAQTDRHLLQQFVQRHDEDAFAELVRRHGPMVLGVCRRLLGDAHAAEDAFQATFLVLVRKAGAISWRETIGSWLYQVACRTA